MLTNFLTSVFSYFGYTFMNFTQMIEYSTLVEKWYNLLNPSFLFSFISHFVLFYGIIYICFILPFRYFKYVLKVPNKKGEK